MGSINIGGENANDAFYRYKMPKMQAKIEGRGNGIKTNIVNNADIAKALERPAEYVLKFFGYELGAQTKYDKKSGNSIVNGAHDLKKLNEMLESFIKKYVQCYSCGNPETVVKIKKENILLKCKACGFVSEVDPMLKLNGFIVKNPPENKLSKAEKKVKKAEKERLKGLESAASGDTAGGDDKKKKKKKSSKKEDGTDDGVNGNQSPEEPDDDDDEDDDEEEDDDEVVWMTDTSEAAVQARAAEQLSAATAAMVTQGNIEAEREAALKRAEEARRKEEEEAARKKEEAEKKLAEELAAKMSIAGGDETVVKLMDMLAAEASPKAVATALKEADITGGPLGRMKALYTALFAGLPEDQKLAPAVVARKSYLAPHAQDPAGQLAQIVALEWLVGVKVPSRAKETPLILKVLYDEDLAEEDYIVAWNNKVTAGAGLDVPEEAAKAVRAAAAPFIAWLEEDEDDSDDEDESEEE